MTPYNNKSNKKSGVTAYKIGSDYIIVQFNNTQNYKYSYRSAGQEVVEEMKRRALASEGLSGYISKKYPTYE